MLSARAVNITEGGHAAVLAVRLAAKPASSVALALSALAGVCSGTGSGQSCASDADRGGASQFCSHGARLSLSPS